MRGVTPRQRALQTFAHLGVWDTDANNGVLIYVLWADRDVEIVADRGIHGKVGSSEWEAVCRTMETAFRDGHYAEGAEQGIARISALLAQHFPRVAGSRANELPDRPLIL